MKKIGGLRMGIFIFVLTVILGFSFQKSASAAVSGSVTTNRSKGTCSYTVSNLSSDNKTITLQVLHSDDKSVALKKEIELSDDDIKEGKYTGSIALKDVNYDCSSYSVNIIAGSETVKLGVCDFSIHQSKMGITVGGNSSDSVRTFRLNSTETSDGVLVPGEGNKVSVYVWKEGNPESTAILLGASKDISNDDVTWSLDITKAGKSYGQWNAKLVLSNANWKSPINVTKTADYNVGPVASNFVVKKTNALEKKKSFRVLLSGVENPYGVSGVKFYLYNTKNKKAAAYNAKLSGKKYYANVTMKKLKYKLDQYTVIAKVVDNDGKKVKMEATAIADQRAQIGNIKVSTKNNATSVVTISNPYIPGGIKNITCVTYKKNKKIGTYNTKTNKKKLKYSATTINSSAGTYNVKIYGMTTWNKKVLIGTKKFKVSKKNLGKQGWKYIKYNGKKYKMYFINNEPVTDATKYLDLKKGSGKFYVEVNRAACVVNIYMWDDETNKYDICVKTCTVCVGRDVRTNAGAGALNLSSSFTPIGTYSVCSNGTATKYSNKPMHEPDGSVVYARWATHIVGNVYFHSIAVGSDTHYGLSSYKFNLLGSPASAGCIRMAVADAKWIYDYIPSGTTVKIVKGSSSKPGPMGKLKMPKSVSVNYDPTDPSVPDSKKKKDYKAGKITGYLSKSGKRVGY